jgi:hypothetical protein
MRRWITVLALLVCALALVAVGCGGGDDEASDDSGITATETTDTETDTTETEDTTTDDSGTDTDTDTGDVTAFLSEDCQGLVAAYVALSGAFGAAGSEDVSGQVEQFREYAEQVPDEIRGDVEALATVYGEYIDELQDLGLEAGEVPSADQIAKLQAAGQSLGTSEVQEASDRLSAWTTENCSG